MSLTLVTAPTVEPVTLAEFKGHIRVTASGDGTYISALIKAARMASETITARALIDQTWDLKFDRFPRRITVPLPTLQTITSITYTDTAGVSQTLSSSLYKVDTNGDMPGRIDPAYGESWPSTRGEMNAVVVRFVAGYGAAGSNVPEPIKQAIMMYAAELYERREDAIVGATIERVPNSVNALLWPYKVWGASS